MTDMKTAWKYILPALLFAFSALSSSAAEDKEPNMYGIDPQRDSISMNELRHYLDGIRKKRPTVALVLAGGGAKGMSHIGVMEYLDSLEIPVDVVHIIWTASARNVRLSPLSLPEVVRRECPT